MYSLVKYALYKHWIKSKFILDIIYMWFSCKLMQQPVSGCSKSIFAHFRLVWSFEISFPDYLNTWIKPDLLLEKKYFVYFKHGFKYNCLFITYLRFLFWYFHKKSNNLKSERKAEASCIHKTYISFTSYSIFSWLLWRRTCILSLFSLQKCVHLNWKKWKLRCIYKFK